MTPAAVSVVVTVTGPAEAKLAVKLVRPEPPVMTKCQPVPACATVISLYWHDERATVWSVCELVPSHLLSTYAIPAALALPAPIHGAIAHATIAAPAARRTALRTCITELPGLTRTEGSVSPFAPHDRPVESPRQGVTVNGRGSKRPPPLPAGSGQHHVQTPVRAQHKE